MLALAQIKSKLTKLFQDMCLNKRRRRILDADTDESTVLQEINFIPEESPEQDDASNQLLHSMSKENVEELRRDFKKL